MSYYEEKLIQGQEYQDFVMDNLANRGMAINNYSSKKYQFKKGENKLGMEIKLDNKYAETGNLFIEVAERRNKNEDYVDSGIFRKDNSWLYLVGNYNIAFIFFKKHLQVIRKNYRIVEGEKQTSKGFLLRPNDVKRVSGKAFHFSKEKITI